MPKRRIFCSTQNFPATKTLISKKPPAPDEPPIFRRHRGFLISPKCSRKGTLLRAAGPVTKSQNHPESQNRRPRASALPTFHANPTSKPSAPPSFSRIKKASSLVQKWARSFSILTGTAYPIFDWPGGPIFSNPTSHPAMTQPLPFPHPSDTQKLRSGWNPPPGPRLNLHQYSLDIFPEAHPPNRQTEFCQRVLLVADRPQKWFRWTFPFGVQPLKTAPSDLHRRIAFPNPIPYPTTTQTSPFPYLSGTQKTAARKEIHSGSRLNLYQYSLDILSESHLLNRQTNSCQRVLLVADRPQKWFR